MPIIVDISQDLAGYLEINLILKIAFVYLIVLWISLILWVTRDAINRSNNLLFQIFVIILNICLPVFGLIIYLIIRPTKTLLEKYYEDLEYKALAENGEEREICQNCKLEVSREYDFCPNCAVKLKQECMHCNKEFSKRWKFCPFCGMKQGTVKDKKKKDVKK